jgi:hypothetical protein
MGWEGKANVGCPFATGHLEGTVGLGDKRINKRVDALTCKTIDKAQRLYGNHVGLDLG